MRNSGAKRAMHCFGFTVATAALFACGQTPSDSSQTKIYGGKKTKTGEWQSTIAITSPNGHMFCSGTAVAPRLVITAAHCVQGSSNPSSLRVYIGEGKEGGAVKPQYTTVKFGYSPKYGRNPGGWNDIAYLVLDKDMDLPPEAFVPVLTDKDEINELLKPGVYSHIVGFGNRDGGGFGMKYETDAPITSVDLNEVAIGSDGKDSCQGDSGGPAYGQLKNGQWRVYGIVSRGGACGFGGIWGLMHSNVCWVEQESGIKLGLNEEVCKAETEPTDEGKEPEENGREPSFPAATPEI